MFHEHRGKWKNDSGVPWLVQSMCHMSTVRGQVFGMKGWEGPSVHSQMWGRQSCESKVCVEVDQIATSVKLYIIPDDAQQIFLPVGQGSAEQEHISHSLVKCHMRVWRALSPTVMVSWYRCSAVQHEDPWATTAKGEHVDPESDYHLSRLHRIHSSLGTKGYLSKRHACRSAIQASAGSWVLRSTVCSEHERWLFTCIPVVIVYSCAPTSK